MFIQENEIVPAPVPPKTYTVEMSQQEIDMLSVIIGNTAGAGFHQRISSMYRDLSAFSTPRDPYCVEVDGYSYKVRDPLTFDQR